MAQIKSPVKIMKLNIEHNLSFEITVLAISLDLRSSTNEYIVVVCNVSGALLEGEQGEQLLPQVFGTYLGFQKSKC